MKKKCNNGFTVERFYERSTRSSVVRLIDSYGNQIGDADYSGSKASADFAEKTMITANGGLAKKGS